MSSYDQFRDRTAVFTLSKGSQVSPSNQGDFVINNREVSVSSVKSKLLSATLYWVPFWVNHDDMMM